MVTFYNVTVYLPEFSNYNGFCLNEYSWEVFIYHLCLLVPHPECSFVPSFSGNPLTRRKVRECFGILIFLCSIFVLLILFALDGPPHFQINVKSIWPYFFFCFCNPWQLITFRFPQMCCPYLQSIQWHAGPYLWLNWWLIRCRLNCKCMLLDYFYKVMPHKIEMALFYPSHYKFRTTHILFHNCLEARSYKDPKVNIITRSLTFPKIRSGISPSQVIRMW